MMLFLCAFMKTFSVLIRKFEDIWNCQSRELCPESPFKVSAQQSRTKLCLTRTNKFITE